MEEEFHKQRPNVYTDVGKECGKHAKIHSGSRNSKFKVLMPQRAIVAFKEIKQARMAGRARKEGREGGFPGKLISKCHGVPLFTKNNP